MNEVAGGEDPAIVESGRFPLTMNIQYGFPFEDNCKTEP
jgi:hypothetical protein